MTDEIFVKKKKRVKSNKLNKYNRKSVAMDRERSRYEENKKGHATVNNRKPIFELSTGQSISVQLFQTVYNE